MSEIDGLVDKILDLSQEIVGHDTDPGDIQISIQDDMALTTVMQSGVRDFIIGHSEHPFSFLGVGSTLSQAIENYLEMLRDLSNEQNIGETRAD